MTGLEKRFAWMWKAYDGPQLTQEHVFCPGRAWRFDFAHLPARLAIECEGGTWTGGRHTTGKGFEGDCVKYNEATFLGWRVFRLTAELITAPTIKRLIELTQ